MAGRGGENKWENQSRGRVMERYTADQEFTTSSTRVQAQCFDQKKQDLGEFPTFIDSKVKKYFFDRVRYNCFIQSLNCGSKY